MRKYLLFIPLILLLSCSEKDDLDINDGDYDFPEDPINVDL